MPHSTWPLGWTGGGGRTDAGGTTIADGGALIGAAQPASDEAPTIPRIATKDLDLVINFPRQRSTIPVSVARRLQRSQ